MHSFNHIYRLVWSRKTQSFVAVAETTHSHSQGGSGPRRKLIALLVLGCLTPNLATAFSNAVTGSISNEGIQNGTQNILNGGHAIDTTIDNYGRQIISSGGNATNTTINSAGGQVISSGGSATNTIINDGGNQAISSGGIASNTTINDGGQQEITETGLAIDTTVNSGGQQLVAAYGSATGTTLNSQGAQYVYNFGSATDIRINDGAQQQVFLFGSATDITINNGGVQLVGDYGSVTDTTINSGGQQQILADGVAENTTINSGGFQLVNGGGSVTSTTINGGGQLNVDIGGTASEVNQLSGGALVTTTSASVSGSNASGSFVVDATSNYASNVWLENGGSLTVFAGGTAAATTVHSEGTLSLETNTTLNGTTQVNGTGNLEATGLISNNGTLQINKDQGTNLIISANLNGSGSLVQQGANTTTIASNTFNQNSVTVNGGTLSFQQNATFTTTGNYTTNSGGETTLGAKHTYLDVGGIFTQANGSVLNVTLNDQGKADIKADSAVLGGTINIDGFIAGPTPTKASQVTNGRYTLISTTNGISGIFANNPLSQDGADYLLHEGFVTNGGKDYELGFRLAWDEGGQTSGTGSFTLGAGTAFDVDIILGTQSGSFDSQWDGNSLSKAGEGLLMLSAQNTYTGTTTINAGTLQMGIVDSIAQSSDVIINGGTLDLNGNAQQVNRLSGSGGQVTLNGATLTLNQGSANTSYAGNVMNGTTAGGGIVKTGSGSLTLTGQTGWTGITDIQGGTLILDGVKAQLVSNVQGSNNSQLTLQNGASLTGSIDPVALNVGSASTWNMTGDSLLSSLNLAGTLNFVAPTSQTFKTLTIDGNYTGQDGLVVFNGALNGDSSSVDHLVIQGDTSGNTSVSVTNIGGGGAATVEGIQLIQVGGQSDGTFTQQGRIVAGAYDYQLVRGSGENASNWYLTSDLNIRPEGGSYASNLAWGRQLFTLQRDDYTQANDGQARRFWLRAEGGQQRGEDGSGQLDQRNNHSLLQLGSQLGQWQLGKDTSVQLGVLGGYGSNRNQSRSKFTEAYADGDVSGYHLGLYGDWQAQSDGLGTYLSGWAHYSWLDNTVKGSGQASESYKASGLSASLEAGYSLKLAENSLQGRQFILQPQAQLSWLGVKANDHRESGGTLVRSANSGSLQTRVGIKALLRQAAPAVGQITPALEVNWLHQSRSAAVELDGARVTASPNHNLGEIKLGLEAPLSKQLTFSGKLGYQFGQNGYRDTGLMLEVKGQF